MSLHQGLRVLMEHRVASGIVAMATLTFLLMLLPRIILPFVLGMIASPILILATAVSPTFSSELHAGSQATCWWSDPTISAGVSASVFATVGEGTIQCSTRDTAPPGEYCT